MKVARLFFVLLLVAMVAEPALAQRGGRGGPPQLTPEQEVARVRAQVRLLRPLERLDTVWLEEMTVTEVAYAINGGKTTALILTGGVEDNGPHLAQSKHNDILHQTGEAIARRLGDALIAPIVTLEPTGNVSAVPSIGRAGPMISQETYLALLTDIGDHLRAMGFTTILYLGDSGGNTNGMHGAANALNAKYRGDPANFYHIPEYHDFDPVQEYIQNQLGIPEQIRIGSSSGWADGLHEEYGIDALMALEDPDTIRFHQRVKAGRAIINGVPLEPLETLLDHGRQLLEIRTRHTVAGIDSALASPPPVYGQAPEQVEIVQVHHPVARVRHLDQIPHRRFRPARWRCP